MGPGEGEESIPGIIGGEAISGTVSGLGAIVVGGLIGLEDGAIGIGAMGIGGGVIGIGGGAIAIGGGAIIGIGGGVIIGIGGGVIIGIGEPPLGIGGMDMEPEGAIMGD
ncbi:shematrin-like protein 2 [Brassica rapa]|uniref:shematrin-like protein 2 n=1 Tax=Brassica campestris TaxID=3711 RepID=UPI00142D355C|nr:shematrin-like protein 2 [Brassica rapa]